MFKNLNEALSGFKLRQGDWNTILKIDKKEKSTAFKNFLLTLNHLLQQHASLKKLSNKKSKVFKKLWITIEILYKIYNIYFI